MSLKCGKGLEEGRGSSSAWSHPYDITCVGICRGAKENSRGKKIKERKKRCPEQGWHGGRAEGAASGSLNPMVVFCDSHKQVAQTVIIVPLLFLF